jgi:predicted RNA-binding Zn ribbon-like protein
MSRFYFIANNLALDLANTLAADGEGREVELLGDLDDLLYWAVEAGIINRKQAADARERADDRTCYTVLKETRELRSALKSMAAALAVGKAVPKAALEQINAELARKAGHFEIVRTPDGYRSSFNIGYDRVADLMRPVAESAMDLLCYGDPGLVKKCGNPACVLYFYDTSKRHGRKWCSMSACGNRAKAAAFYDMNRQSTAS